MNTETTDPATGVAKKAPRKPRPSEIAAKKAKAAKKSKRKPAPKKKVRSVRWHKAAKKLRKPKARKTKAKAVQWSAARACRMDVRMSKAQKRKLDAKAKAKGRTVTSMILEAVDKLR